MQNRPTLWTILGALAASAFIATSVQAAQVRVTFEARVGPVPIATPPPDAGTGLVTGTLGTFDLNPDGTVVGGPIISLDPGPGLFFDTSGVSGNFPTLVPPTVSSNVENGNLQFLFAYNFLADPTTTPDLFYAGELVDSGASDNIGAQIACAGFDPDGCSINIVDNGGFDLITLSHRGAVPEQPDAVSIGTIFSYGFEYIPDPDPEPPVIPEPSAGLLSALSILAIGRFARRR